MAVLVFGAGLILALVVLPYFFGSLLSNACGIQSRLGRLIVVGAFAWLAWHILQS